MLFSFLQLNLIQCYFVHNMTIHNFTINDQKKWQVLSRATSMTSS